MIRLLVHTDKTYELDTYGDENIAITYAIDDITDIEKKVGNYSKSFPSHDPPLFINSQGCPVSVLNCETSLCRSYRCLKNLLLFFVDGRSNDLL